MTWIEPVWPVAKNIHAAVTLRKGGVSSGQYDSLNLADHVNDKPLKVQENRAFISQILYLPSEPVWLQQSHGKRVVNAGQAAENEQSDASYTHKAGIVNVVLTADCLPILVASADGIKIAAIHAGWRGLLAGIITATVKALKTTEMIVWLGPAIGPDCFEVGGTVRDMFAKKSEKYSSAFRQQKNNTYLANIYQLARIEFASLGMTQIYGGDFCTFTDKERFFSYRRDGETGRMATLIWRD